MSGRRSLIVYCLIVLAACAPQTPVISPQPPMVEAFTLPPTWTPKVQQVETAAPANKNTLAPTFTREPTFTLAASLTPPPEINLSATPILGYCSQAESACEITVRPSTRRGWCSLSNAESSCGLIYDYSLLYPQTWIVDTVGVLRPNLLFDTGSQNSQVNMLQLPAGDLNLDTADGVLACNEGGDCIAVVSPEEIIVRRQQRSYANRDYLFLTSSLGDVFITRYFMFLQHSDIDTRLYIIQIRVPAILVDSEEYNLHLEQAKIMIGSIRADNSVEVTPYGSSLTPASTTTVLPTETPTP